MFSHAMCSFVFISLINGMNKLPILLLSKVKYLRRYLYCLAEHVPFFKQIIARVAFF